MLEIGSHIETEVLEDHLEFDARTGTVVKVSVSTFSLAISFCVLKHFPVIKTEKT